MKKHVISMVAGAVAAAAMLFSGASVANAATASDHYDAISVSNARVSDVGAHSVGVSFDYSIKPEVLDQISGVCVIVDVQRIISLTRTGEVPPFGTAPYDMDCTGTDDEDLDPSAYERIYGIHTASEPFGVSDENGVYTSYATGTYQSFYRYYTNLWDGSATGTFDTTVIGLTPSTTYGNNTGNTYPLNYGANGLFKAQSLPFNTPTPVNLLQTFAGVKLTFKDGSSTFFEDHAVPVNGFTTTAEPTAPSEGDLTDANKGNIGGNDTAASKSVYRAYIDDLKAECKAKVDAGEDCFWNGYIYSSPRALTDKSGSPLLAVQKDDAGRYYVDAYIPAIAGGDHKIVLTDETGAVQGWKSVSVTAPLFTDVTEGDNANHADDVLALAKKGVIGGFNNADGTKSFRGLEQIKRQDFVAFLYRLAGSPEFDEAKATKTFTDVKAGDNANHSKAVLWAASKGIVGGFGDNTFRGTQQIKRQDAAAFLYRLAGNPEFDEAKATKTFTDVKAGDNANHSKEILWAASNGIVGGFGDNTFRGTQQIKRQDAAAFLNRLDGRVDIPAIYK